MSARARIWFFLVLALALLIGAGVAYVQPNRVVLTGTPVVAEVLESQQGDPSTMTVRFTTADGRQVETTTSKLYGVPPPGAGVLVRYDPDDPTTVVAEEYRETSPVATLLVVAFTASFGAAVITWRRSRTAPR